MLHLDWKYDRRKTGDVTISSGYSHGNLQDSGAISLIAGGSNRVKAEILTSK